MKKGLLAAALAVMLTLTACGGAESDRSAEDLPRLVIASDNYKPYSYVGPNGNLIGVDVDLATEACRRLGYAPEFCQIVWENKDAYLSSGQADCLWGSFTMTGREDLYQWAGPYLYSRQMVAVRANSDIHTLADLAGLRVAVQATGKPEALFLTSSAPGVSQVEAVYAFSTMDKSPVLLYFLINSIRVESSLPFIIHHSPYSSLNRSHQKSMLNAIHLRYSRFIPYLFI